MHIHACFWTENHVMFLQVPLAQILCQSAGCCLNTGFMVGAWLPSQNTEFFIYNHVIENELRTWKDDVILFSVGDMLRKHEMTV